MSRSKWKGPFIHFNFLRKKLLTARGSIVWSRNSVVLSQFVGYKFLIHSGNTFKKFFVTREKIGFKFGEFCTTRAKFFHKNKLKVNKPKKNFLKKKKKK